MHDFDYVRAASVGEAAEALAAAEDGRLLAGGMTLLPALKQRLAQPTVLIDLAGIAELRQLRRQGASLEVGALVTHARLAESPDVQALLPALAELATRIGDPQVRNRGTLGGALANNDPAADYPAAVLGLDATVITDRRRIPADAFFTGLFETALARDEVVTGALFPLPERAGYAKFRQPASRYALVGVFVARLADGSVRVAVTGAAPCAFRHREMEAALARSFTPAALDRVETPALGLNSDLHGSAEYRAHLVRVMAKRAVAAAC